MVVGVFNAFGFFGHGVGIVLTGSAFTYLSMNASHYIGAVVMALVAVIAHSLLRHWYDESPPPASEFS